MAFRPYFDRSLNDDIRTQAEHDMVQRVLRMDYEQIQALMVDLNAEAAINPAFEWSRECNLQSKAVIRRTQQLKKAGQWGPTAKVGFFNLVDLAMQGMIMGSEFAYRFMNVPRK